MIRSGSKLVIGFECASLHPRRRCRSCRSKAAWCEYPRGRPGPAPVLRPVLKSVGEGSLPQAVRSNATPALTVNLDAGDTSVLLDDVEHLACGEVTFLLVSFFGHNEIPVGIGLFKVADGGVGNGCRPARGFEIREQQRVVPAADNGGSVEEFPGFGSQSMNPFLPNCS